MENIEIELQAFRVENAAKDVKIDSLTALVESLAAQVRKNAASLPSLVIFAREEPIRPVATRPDAAGPNSCFHPWEGPAHFSSKGYQQTVEICPPTPVYATAPPVVTLVVVNVGPHAGEVIYHHDSAAPSENGDVHDRLDGFQDQF